MKPIIIHSEARAELDQAMGYYEQQKAGLGLDLQAEVERIIGEIQQTPGIGSPYKRTDFRCSLVRRFPYMVYYMELPEVIWIAAIAHGKRRPGYWRKRRVEGGE